MSKKIISFFMVLSMCVSLSIFQANTVFAEEILSEQKIADELKMRLKDACEDDLIPVYIWIDDIKHEEIESLTSKDKRRFEESG